VPDLEDSYCSRDENPKLKEDTAAAQVPDSMKKVKGVICMRFAHVLPVADFLRGQYLLTF